MTQTETSAAKGLRQIYSATPGTWHYVFRATGATVTATVELDMDMITVIDMDTVAEGTAERDDNFESSFRTDMAAALGINASRIEILSIQGGSVSVAVLPASDGTPLDESVMSYTFAASGVFIAGVTTAAPVRDVAAAIQDDQDGLR